MYNPNPDFTHVGHSCVFMSVFMKCLSKTLQRGFVNALAVEYELSITGSRMKY